MAGFRTGIDLVDRVMFVDGSEFRTDPANPTPPLDPPPPPDDDEGYENLPDTPTCDVCELPIDLTVEWAGRGRKPKRHKACRAGARSSGSTSDTDTATPRKRGSANRFEKLSHDLSSGMAQAAAGLGMFAPVTAGVLMLRAPNTADALVDLAREHPALLEGLEKAAQVLPWMELAYTGGSLVYALGVDVGRLQPFGIVPEALGVARVAERVGYRVQSEPPAGEGPTIHEYQEPPSPFGGVVNNITIPKPAPPRFVTVE